MTTAPLSRCFGCVSVWITSAFYRARRHLTLRLIINSFMKLFTLWLSMFSFANAWMYSVAVQFDGFALMSMCVCVRLCIVLLLYMTSYYVLNWYSSNAPSWHDVMWNVEKIECRKHTHFVSNFIDLITLLSSVRVTTNDENEPIPLPSFNSIIVIVIEMGLMVPTICRVCVTRSL